MQNITSTMKFSTFLWISFLCLTAFGMQQQQLVESEKSYNILAFFPTEVKSHFMGLLKPLVRALVAKGHNITLVSPYSIGETSFPYNFVQVELSPPFDFDMIDIAKYALPEPLGSWAFGPFNTDQTLSKPSVKNFIRKDQTAFDVILFENFLHECFVALGHKYGAPVVQLLGSSSSVRVSQWYSQPYDPAYIPEFSIGFPVIMSFWQRTLNTVSAFFHTWASRVFYIPRHQTLMDKHFVYPGHETRPPIVQLLRNVSLTLVNSHHSAVGSPVPMIPTFVDVAGMHCASAKPLPKDLKAIVESSVHGVVYFSLGSVVKSSKMPSEMVSLLLAELSTLKQTVLWKWENDQLPNLPSNVIVRKWYPQNDILGHPNCKLFITHGGIHSTIETTYHGVPMLGISVFGDQPQNVILAEQRGYAIHVPYFGLTKDSFGNALRRLIDDPSYLANAKRVSKIFNDNPIPPLNKAVYWIEYVTRHGGALHMRTAANNLYWFQFYLLDVIAFWLVVTFIAAYVTLKLFTRCCRKNKQSKIDKKNQ